jgi:site-specific recombinase XerD
MRYCAEGGRKFQRDIQRSRTLYGKRNLRFVRNNDVLYWRFLSYLEDMGYRPRTVERYHEKLRTFLKWLGQRSVRRVKREDVEKFLLWFKQERIRSPSPYTIRYVREALAVFFGFLMMHAALPRNPAKGLRIRTHFPQPERLDLFSPEEMLLLLKAPREHRQRLNRSDFPTELSFNAASYSLLAHYLILKLMFSTGIRPCEIANARREDLEETALLLRVRNKGHQQYVTEERRLFLSPRTVCQLKELLAMGESRRGATSAERLFIDYHSGNPLSSFYASKVVKQWAPRCGITRNVYAYMCRYTYCTRLVENGADPYSLKRLMGHKQMATSLIHYLKLTPRELRREWREYNPLAGGGAL